MVGYPQLVLYFFVYSFIGWTFESILCSCIARKPVNRGFLHGPFCPVYGVGVLSVLVLAGPLKAWPPLVFLVSLLAVTLVEYFTGWLLESLFSMRWWDYSTNRFNIKGRICLQNSLFFGLMGLIILYLVHPPIAGLLGALPRQYLRVIASCLMVMLVIDLMSTLGTLLRLGERLQGLQTALAELDALNKEHGWYDKTDPSGSLLALHELLVERPEDAELLALTDKLIEAASGRSARKERRLLRAYPTLRAPGLDAAIDRLRERGELLPEKLREQSESLRAKTKTANEKTKAVAKRVKNTYREQISLTRLGWVFLLAGVIGYLLETAFCIVTTGGVESRQGLLFGPFNQVYGFGAVLMALLLTPLSHKSDRWIFFGGALVGGSFEFLCSLLQEQIFGTVSWDYSNYAGSFFGGRTSLLFMFFWGILGVWFIKHIYPWLCRIVDRIPRRQGRVLCAVMMFAICLNMAFSALSVLRWSERVQGIPPANTLEEYLDERFDDEMMREVYPNMIHLE